MRLARVKMRDRLSERASRSMTDTTGYSVWSDTTTLESCVSDPSGGRVSSGTATGKGRGPGTFTEVEVAVSSEQVTAENNEANSPVISEEADWSCVGGVRSGSSVNDRGCGGAGSVVGTNVAPWLGPGMSVGSKAG